MNVLQDIKIVSITPPGAIVDNAAFTTAELDTKGYRKVTLVVLLGALDIAIAEMKAQHSDVTGTGFTDIDGADFSVSPATLPSATDDNLIFAIHLDMRGKKRFVELSLTGGDGAAGTYATVFALLSNGEESPSTAALRGYSQELIA